MGNIISIACLAFVVLGASFMPARAAPVDPEPAAHWNATFDGKSGWIGGDAVYSVQLSAGRILWLFGDSLIGKVVDGGRSGTVFVAGMFIAAFVSIPVVNLAAPLFAMAFMVHMYKRMTDDPQRLMDQR